MDFERAVIVGTGFGGAVAACRLSQAGFAPLVLERGRRFEAGDFPALPPDSGFLPDARRLGWARNQGLVDVQDLGELISVQAAGYGGGSLIYANVHLRPPADIFEQEEPRTNGDGNGEESRRLWPAAYTRGALDPFYDLVASMLDVAPITEHAEGAELVKADQLRRAAPDEAAFFHPPLAISRREGLNAHGQRQKACVQCGACCMGCPNSAKNSLDYNYLAVAEAFGARVKTQCEVSAIERISGGYRVRYLDHLCAERGAVETRALFVCAGSIHTTRLLLTAELGRTAAEEERSPVGLGYWPNADALGVVFDTEHPQYPSWGPTITCATVFRERKQTDPDERPPTQPARQWFMLQDGGYSRDLERMIGLMRSPIWAGRNGFPRTPGGAAVRASPGEPPRTPTERGAPSLPSPLDSVLQAFVSGAFDRAVPLQLVQALPAIRDRVSQVLLPAIVSNTLERAMRARLREQLPFVPAESWLERKMLAVARKLTEILGTREEIARHAHDALEHLGGLTPTELAERCLGYAGAGAERRAMLLAMGPDSTPGALRWANGELKADLDLFHLAPRYLDEELAMRDVAKALGGELRVNPAWAFLGKPITVHSQGGCRLSDSPRLGVLDPNGQVWGCEGLYVLDGAALPTSVGVNPSATIAAIAERNVLSFIRTHTHADWPEQGYAQWPENDRSAGAESYRRQLVARASWVERARRGQWTLEPPLPATVAPRSQPFGVAFDERMSGFCAVADGGQYAELFADAEKEVDEAYRVLEGLGRPAYPIAVELTPHVENLPRFLEDETHRMRLQGKVRARLPGDDSVRTFTVARGFLELFRARCKDYALGEAQKEAQRRIAGSYVSAREPEERPMRYELEFEDHLGVLWRLEGYKRIRDDAGLDAWRDTTTLFVRLVSGGRTRAAGAIHVDLPGFLDQLRSMRIVTADARPVEAPDPARVAWTLIRFTQFFFGSLQRIYLPEIEGVLEALLQPAARRRQS
jgi:choline dehydrogenase-like flavoprotein